jgi:hypothetical protein
MPGMDSETTSMFDGGFDSDLNPQDTHAGFGEDTSGADTQGGSINDGQQQQQSDVWDVPGIGQVPREELIKGYLRQQDYTRKTMAMSQRDREAEQLRQNYAAMEATLGQVRAFLQDRAQLENYLRQLPGGEPEIAPDTILTAAEAQQLMQRQLGTTQNQFAQQVQQAEQRILQNVYEQQYTQSIDSKLREVGTRHPELTRVPGMELLLREAVKSQKPQSIEQVLSLFDQAAAYYSTQLKGLAKQQVAVKPNNPLNRGIEPPSGGAPMPEPEPTEFTGVKDPNLRNLVMQDLMRMSQRAR